MPMVIGLMPCALRSISANPVVAMLSDPRSSLPHTSFAAKAWRGKLECNKSEMFFAQQNH